MWLQNRPMNFVTFNTDQHLTSRLPLTVNWLKKYTKQILRLSQAFYITVRQCSGMKVESTEQRKCNCFSYKNFKWSKIISLKQHKSKLIWYDHSTFQSDSIWCTFVKTPNCCSTLFTSSLITIIKTYFH